MHNSSHDIEAPLTIQTHTILLQIKTEFEEPFSEFHKAFFPPFLFEKICTQQKLEILRVCVIIIY